MKTNMSVAAQPSACLPMDDAQVLERRADAVYKKLDFNQASQLLLDAIEKRKEAVGATDPSIATVLEKLAGIYMQQNKLPEAETTLAEAAQILETAYYSGHGLLAPVLEHQADCLIKERKYAEAEPVLKKAEEIYANTMTMENRTTLRSLYKLAKLYMTLDKPTDAQTLLKSAMKHVDTPLGPVAEFRYQLALAYLQSKNVAEAKPLLQDAIIGFKQRNHSSRVADCLETYGTICRESGETIQAEELLIQAATYRQRGSASYPKDIFLATLLRA